MHYYQHHIGDFIKATARLTDSQVMAYLRLIWHYYDHDGVVKNDPVQISFEIGSDVELIKQIIKTFFDVDGEFLRHSRCDKEIEGYKNKSAGGKKGAESRWGNNKKDSIPMANPLATQSEPNATPILTINHKPITNLYTSEFESFWKAYQKPTGKANAFKEWKKLKPSEELIKTIISKATLQAKLVDRQYRKDAERWLRDKRWEDELLTSSVNDGYRGVEL